MKPKIKPRNPFVVLAKFRKSGSHEKPAKSIRRQENQSLAKAIKQSPESWHKRISIECASAMTSTPSGCGAVGSAPRLGRGGRWFEPSHPDHQNFLEA
jgi:hypothetical protein